MRAGIAGAGLSALLFAAAAAPAFAGDAGHGGQVFKTQCTVCHRAEKGAATLVGPNLFGIVGRKAGTLPGFAYSPAMKAVGWTWSAAQLTTYLKSPMTVVSGTKMTFVGLKKPGDAEDVAAYLATLK